MDMVALCSVFLAAEGHKSGFIVYIVKPVSVCMAAAARIFLEERVGLFIRQPVEYGFFAYLGAMSRDRLDCSVKIPADGGEVLRFAAEG